MESNDSGRLRRQSDGQMRRLMAYYFRAYSLVATDQSVDRFLGIYDCFMRVIPQEERDAARLDRLVRAAFAIRDSTPRAEGGDEAQVTATLAELTARFAQEQARRAEEEALRREVQEELLKVEGTVTSLYGDLLDQIERQQSLLAERETRLVRREREAQTRLLAIQALESALKTALERTLHTEAHTLLGERVEEVAGELAAVRDELAELDTLEPVGDAHGGPPLVTVIRRLKGGAEAAGLDPLTGLRTRELGEYLEKFSRALESGDPAAENVSLLYFHIDGFHELNERHGRSIADSALQQVARILKTLRRGSDVAYCFDEAEMIVLLPHTSVAGAWNVAEILRRQIADLMVETPQGEGVRLTVSVGGCDTLNGGLAIARCAAEALRRAGQGGGNHTVLYSDDERLASLGDVVPAEFAAIVRERLLRQERYGQGEDQRDYQNGGDANWAGRLYHRIVLHSPRKSAAGAGLHLNLVVADYDAQFNFSAP